MLIDGVSFFFFYFNEKMIIIIVIYFENLIKWNKNLK